jgi:hypothetical protein
MAVKNLENLVLRGVNVACDVVTGLSRIGSNTVQVQTPAMALSHSRHPSHSDREAGLDSGPWYVRAETFGAANAAERAGRPGCCPGVSASRIPARAVGRTVLSGWSLAVEEPYPPTPCYSGRFTAGMQRSVDQGCFQRLQRNSARSLQRGGLSSRPVLTSSGKRRILEMAWPRPFEGTLLASRRGK